MSYTQIFVIIFSFAFGCSQQPQELPQSSPVKDQTKTKTKPTLKPTVKEIVKPKAVLSSNRSSVSLPSNVDLKLPLITEVPSKISGPKNVSRWEPSGIVASDEGIWVISDRKAWLTYYSLPLKKGDNTPQFAHQLKPNLKNRIKFEGLEWERNSEGQVTALLILEAISRSIWRCESPRTGCPRLTRLDPQPVNQILDKSTPTPFKYIMFEAVAHVAGKTLIGVRGYQDKKTGLTPWSLISDFQGKLLLDARKPLQYEGKIYGVSGASYDPKNNGFWITWSHEDEKGSTKESVRGLLTFAPLQEAKGPEDKSNSKLEYGSYRLSQSPDQGLKLCAQFQMKPEGVNVNSKGEVFVIFDEDLDRKDSETHQDSGRFPLEDNQDYIYKSTATTLLK